MDCHYDDRTGIPVTPPSTEEKICFDRSGANEKGRAISPFFKTAYPSQQHLRHRMPEQEWNRLDSEFLEAWNHCKASKFSTCCLWMAVFPGILLLGIPVIWVCSIVGKRRTAMEQHVAKVNKYILRPRGMFMKEQTHLIQVEDGYAWGSSWYEIALTPFEVDRLEKSPYEYFISEVPSFVSWLGGEIKPSTRERVTEETVEDDPAFQGRWHAPARRYGDEEENKEEETSPNTSQPLETPIGDMSN
jgi:hypothetical protein